MRAGWISMLLLCCGDGASKPDLDASPPVDAGPDGADPDGAPGQDASSGADASAEVIEPEDPGAGDIRIEVDTTAERVPISRYVYGTNHPEWGGAARGLTLSRAGGNRWTAYNWENNASNAGSDWNHQNDGYLGGGDGPGEAVRELVAAAHAASASEIVTVPIVGYVAADKDGDGDVANTPDYLATRFHRSFARKGSAFSDPPDTGDDVVFQDEFVAWLESEFPGAHADPERAIFYSLDNEPDLWSSTHPRIHPDPVGYDELVELNVEYAAAIKDVAPEAVILGPVNYGWAGYVDLQSAPDAGGRDFLDYWLDRMSAAEALAGRRLVDVLDLHWYPEAQGGGVRITGADASDPVAQARIQAPRSLWDADYIEDSWIAQWSTGGPIALIPRVRGKIEAHYPGTKLGFTEYYYGGGTHISGALAEADVLGIFGREGVFEACLWGGSADEDRFIYAAFKMYVDYDGAGGAFGSTSVAAHVSDIEIGSAHASTGTGTPGQVVMVLLNKGQSELSAAILVRHTSLLARAERYELTAATAAPVQGGAVGLAARNSLLVVLPPLSVTTLVLSPG
ncbi:MAG: endoglucanase A [Deltaproteobacteria bacterium]|nr:endoglucanase A [Deltaproteobacteria bacterium]